MRIKFLHIYFFTLLLGIGVARAQCPNGETPQQMVTGNAHYGGQSISNASGSLYYDQFDPSLGTLIGVDIDVMVLGYLNVNITNTSSSADNFPVVFYRFDRFNFPGIGILQVDETFSYNTGMLAPGATQQQDIWAPINKTASAQITDPVDLAGYQGTGVNDLTYQLATSVMVIGASHYTNNITLQFTHITYSVVYTYCPHSILPNSKLAFAASKGDGNNVLLTWTKEKETDGVQYTPEISKNGLDFVGIGTLQSQSPGDENGIAKYEYHYRVPVIDDNTKLYFRLKQTSPDGRVTYSEVTTLSYQNITERFTIYPNPAENNITLTFETPQRSNLNLSLINSMGQVVESENFHPGGATTHHYRFTRRHPPGVYFIRVVNAATRQQQVIRLMIK